MCINIARNSAESAESSGAGCADRVIAKKFHRGNRVIEVRLTIPAAYTDICN